MALPVNGPSLPGDSSTTRKFYTLTASLREIYDDNVNTSSVNKVSSLETELSPSVLVDFPSSTGDFSARYTFDLTYYTDESSNSNNNAGNGGNGSGTNPSSGTFQYTHEFIAAYSHSFSERFSLNLSEDLRYYYEPSLYENVGTAYNNGQYLSNVINGAITSQWTPTFGTTTTYANTVTDYEESAVAAQQNSVENTGNQNFSFAILPKMSLGFGGIVDNITYATANRGYSTYTGYVGAQWSILPSINIVGRGGASYDETVGSSQASVSPYAAATLTWSFGQRSSLSLDYAHEVTPSDQIGANGQVSDRVTSAFRYDITSSLSSHLSASLTSSTVNDQLATSSTDNGYSEVEYYLDTGLTYHYNRYLDLDSGVTLSGVSSNTSAYDYSRDELYFGIRGTY